MVLKNKPLLAVAKVSFGLSLFFSMMLWSIPFLSLNTSTWIIIQERIRVGLDHETVEAYNEAIVNFFLNKSGLDFLNENELAHMEDVRKFVVASDILFAGSLMMAVYIGWFLKDDRKFLTNVIRKTSISVFSLSLIVFAIMLANFNSSFLTFHKILFVENFIFNQNSILKILYPDSFFFILSIVYLTSIMAAGLAIAVFSHKLKFK